MLARQQWRSLAVLAQPASSHDPTSIFAPAGTPAHSIFGLSMLVLGITGAIFLVVVWAAALCSAPLSLSRDRVRARAGTGTDLWEQPDRAIVDCDSVVDRCRSVPRRCPRHFLDGVGAKARLGIGCNGDRTSILVGVSLSEARYCDRQRVAYPCQRSVAFDPDILDDVVG